MSAASGNPFAAALAQIAHPFPKMSPGYKARLIAQFVLCWILALSSLLFITLHVVHSRRLGKSFWLFRSQRVETGRLVVLNSLPFFAIMACLAAAGHFGSRWENYNVFILGNQPYNSSIAQFVPWLAVLLQALFFSITNLYATIGARKNISTSISIFSHAWLQNVILLGSPVLVLVIVTPLILVLNKKANESLRSAQALVPLLTQASQALESGQGFDLQIIGELEQAQTHILALRSAITKWLRVTCIIAVFLIAVVIFINAYSLLLVLTLRSHVKANRTRALKTNGISFVQDKEVVVDHSGQDAPSKSTWQISNTQILSADGSTGPFLVPTQPTRTMSRSPPLTNQNDIALQRLARDLTYAVPIVISMCVVWIICLCIIVSGRFNQKWVLYEMTSDSFSWIYLVGTTCAIWFFTFNLHRAWRTGKALSDTDNSQGSKHHSTSLPQQFKVTLDSRALDREAEDKEGEIDAPSA